MVDFHSLFQGSLFFVSGVVGIMAIIAIVYCISWCFDKSSGDDLLTPDELEARRLAPMLVRQAGLAGILKEEQTKVIKFHFEANSFPYAKETNETEATNDKTSKNAKETNASPDEHVEETVDKPEDAVDKDIQNMEEGKNDDGDDTKEKIDDAVDTSGAEEAQEHPTVEEKEVGSTEKSEEVSVEIGSPSTVESTDESKILCQAHPSPLFTLWRFTAFLVWQFKEAQPITCSTCQGGYGELLSTAWAGLGLGANEEVNSTVKSEPKEGGSVKNDSTDEETKQESRNLEQAEDGICSICLGDYGECLSEKEPSLFLWTWSNTLNQSATCLLLD